jgi:RNA polymerase-binding transcription factor DksA
MTKPKEREAEKASSKSSTKTSSKAPVGKATTTKAQSQPLKTQSQPIKAQSQPLKTTSQAIKTQAPASKTGKSSTKLPAAKAERLEKADKSDRHEKAEKVEKAEKSSKSERLEKAERPEKSDRSERAERSEKSERASERLERASEKAAATPALPTKSPFPKDELGKWRVQLLSRRNEISTDIAGLEKDAMEAEDGHTTPNHLAERGSDADLQDVSLGIAGEEKDIIWQIDRALRKIDESQPIPFGLCEYTKEAIPRSRLALIPWTPLSIEGATHMEEKGLQVEDLLVDG